MRGIISVLKMKGVVCLCFFLFFLLISCGEDDENSYRDTSIDEIPSLWMVDCYQRVGTTFDNAVGHLWNEIDSCDGDSYYVLFDIENKGRVFQVHNSGRNKIERVEDFSYVTSDNCHFELDFDGRIEHWTFASKSYKRDGRRFDREFIYADSLVNGFDVKICNDCREIRHDSLLYYLAPDLRDKVNVPDNRIFSSRILNGKFGSVINYDFIFSKSGNFTFRRNLLGGCDEKKGTYDVVSKDGVSDKLRLKYNDGTIVEYPIVIAADNVFFLYNVGVEFDAGPYGQVLRFDHHDWDF